MPEISLFNRFLPAPPDFKQTRLLVFTYRGLIRTLSFISRQPDEVILITGNKSLDSTGSPRRATLTTEPHLAELSRDRNLTVGVTAFPPPDTFRFLDLQGHTNTSTVPQDWFHVTCTQTAVLSRYACVISLGKMIMKDEGRYGVVIGNELGEFQYFFRAFFTDGKQRILAQGGVAMRQQRHFKL